MLVREDEAEGLPTQLDLLFLQAAVQLDQRRFLRGLQRDPEARVPQRHRDDTAKAHDRAHAQQSLLAGVTSRRAFRHAGCRVAELAAFGFQVLHPRGVGCAHRFSEPLVQVGGAGRCSHDGLVPVLARACAQSSRRDQGTDTVVDVRTTFREEEQQLALAVQILVVLGRHRRGGVLHRQLHLRIVHRTRRALPFLGRCRERRKHRFHRRGRGLAHQYQRFLLTGSLRRRRSFLRRGEFRRTGNHRTGFRRGRFCCLRRLDDRHRIVRRDRLGQFRGFGLLSEVAHVGEFLKRQPLPAQRRWPVLRQARSGFRQLRHRSGCGSCPGFPAAFPAGVGSVRRPAAC